MKIDWVPLSGLLLHHMVQYRVSGQDLWVNITVPGTSNTVRITGLKPSTGYSVRVIAVNDVGPGSSSKILDAVTLKEGKCDTLGVKLDFISPLFLYKITKTLSLFYISFNKFRNSSCILKPLASDFY